MHPKKTFWSRRDFLFQSGGGISGLALAHLLSRDRLQATQQASADPCAAAATGANPFAAKPPHYTPRATAVISLFMSGGVSQVDTFDPKPALSRYAGEPLGDKVDGNIVVRQGFPGPLMPSPFTFQKYGQNGIEVSEIFPHLAQHVDEIAFLRSVYGRSNDHVQATYEMQTGQIRMGFPSVGAWVTYGLGSESANLPAFVVMNDHRGGPGRSARRAERLERRLHAGQLPGHAVPRRGRSDRRSAAAPGDDRRAAARPPRHAGKAERDRSGEASGQLRARRASPHTSWPIGCRAARQTRSTRRRNRK